MKYVVTLLLSLGLLAAAAWADSITTIQLQNRPAEEIIPIIKPMLGADDSVTGQGFQLFIRTTAESLQQIKQMIGKLDVAAKLLQISVFQGNDRDLRALSMDGSFQYQGNNASVSIGSTGNTPRGGDVHLSTRGGSATSHTLSTRGRLTDNPIHTLRVTEGAQGYIETGESIPYFSAGGGWFGGRRSLIGGDIQYKDVTTGFYVLPRVRGNQVILDVSPFKQSQSKTRGGDINTRRASTQITGKLGQWLAIGGTTEQVQRSSTGIGSRDSTQSRNNESIWIKADLVR
ncbi:MAG: secretin N-terminal domain-containing protein [Gammaproteobacteria bacterium]|nr:MAG: secretin N-terminal domain-containing protein [Gammaproteobacteria bacterium]